MSRRELIEDIYPLSPTQQGMLFHTLYAPRSGQYFEQLSGTLRGDLDVEAFQRAWEETVARHPALRTVFLWEKRDTPLQLVYRKVRLPWRREDWRELAPAAQEERFRDLLAGDQEAGFELSKPPLMRFALLRVGERSWRFLWSHHHLLLDGWSLPLVLRDVFQLYPLLRRGEAPALPPGRPYRVFIEWLAEGDPEAAQRFWRRALAGFRAPTPLAVERPVGGGEGFEEVRRELGEGETVALMALARRHRLTASTLVAGAWGALLSRYSGEDDVVFGLTVSGRPAELPGVESIVGLFINTLPLRVAVQPAAALVPWLRDLQARQADLQAHSHTPLADVQRWSEIPRGTPLFDSIVVFENYPLDPAEGVRPDGDLAVEDLATAERTHYPVTVSAVPGARLGLSLSWDTSRVEASAARRMLEHLVTLVAGMVAAPEVRVGDLPLLTAAEQALLREAEPEAVAWPREVPFHQLFAREARRQADAVAVVDGEERITYGALAAAAGEVARRLRAAGVGVEDRVAVLMERSARALAAILGTLQAGAAFLPLDPAYGSRRLARLLASAAPRALWTDGEGLPPELEGVPGRVLSLGARPWDGSGGRVEDGGDGTAASDAAVDLDTLAYVIYTSGSTGEPKGVMVSHRSLANASRAWERAYDLRRDVAVHLQAASLAFDVFTGDLARALACGGRLVICPRDVLLSAADLHALIEHQRVDAAELVPAVVRHLTDHLEETGGDLAGLRLLAVGSDAWYGAELNRLARLCGPHTRLVSSYGVTEATIDSSWYAAVGELRGDAPVPIGRAFANTRLHVVDRFLRRLPPGLGGELVIGGAGLARGYLGRPGMTAARFVPDPFAAGAAGARLYRTGDLARHRPDGQLELLGRADHQVKVRGHRVEPGEVEAVLGEHPAVARCVVVARRDGQAESRLVAYVVPRGGEPSGPELRRFLADLLPAFMVPAAFVVLAELPLTPNGKVDRRALPAPAPAVGGSGAAGAPGPRDAVEEELARIWAEVLRVEAVGIHDDFFDLGGDSILSIQIVSRAGRAGLRLTPRLLFDHPTVAGLAAAVRAVAEAATPAPAPEAPRSGPVPLTPIQRWFFDEGFDDPQHWNQALLLESARPLEPGRLYRAVATLANRHDALRLRFRRDAGGWVQQAAPAGGAVPFSVVDLSALAAEPRRRALEAAAAGVQASLDLGAGPIYRFALFRTDDGRDRLLAVVHHLAVDGASWSVLLQDLEEAYLRPDGGGGDGTPGEPFPPATPFTVWAEKLAALAASASLEEEAPLWLGAPAQVPPVPLDRQGGPGANTVASQRTVSVELGRGETRALLGEAQRGWRAHVDEILLAALALAFRRWTGTAPLLVDLEGHGRHEEMVAGADLSRTVGWFTAVAPVWLEGGDGDPARALREAKQRLRARPRRGVGYGLLRYLGPRETAQRLAAGPRAQLSFNYLGQVDRALGGGDLLRPATESPGPLASRRGRRSYVFEINALATGGRLRVEWTYSEALHRRETVHSLARLFLDALGELVAGTEADGAWAGVARALLPSDFPLARLDEAALAALTAGGPVEDVYPLSPLQEGMLFHSLHAPGSGLYVEHLSWEIVGGGFEPGAFRAAWGDVLERHTALRSDFFWEGLEEPLQVVRPAVRLPWREVDWRPLDAAGRRRALEELMAAERRQGFELGQAPLMRITLARTGEAAWRVVWCHHHALLDGWSLPLVMGDLMALYQGRLEGAPPQLPVARPYRDYIAWLEGRDLAAEPAYWRRMLAGLDGPTPLGLDLAAGGRDAAPDPAEHRARLGEGATAALQAFARRHRLTLNTLLQGAWAVLLSRYSGEEDLVYGSVFSGRPAAFPDAEAMVGLFINALPVRVEARRREPLLPFLRRLQDRLMDLRQHEHVPLVEIQAWSRWPAGVPLFESLFVFENYPVGEALEAGSGEGPEVRDVVSSEGTNFALTLGVAPGRRLTLGLGYDRRRFEATTVQRMAGHLEVLLQALVGEPEAPLGGLPILGAAERAALLVEWNDSGVAPEPPPEPLPCAHLVVRRRAEERPDAVAVCAAGGEALSYGELVRRARALAGELRAAGVGPDVPVGLCAERSTALVVGLLGILEAGGAYLLLDPAYPVGRLRSMVEHSGAPVLLTGRREAELLAGSPARLLPLEGPREAGVARRDGREPTPGNLAYVIYTSGSTGDPKGVELRHAGLCNVIRSLIAVLGLREGDRTLQYGALSFDGAVGDIFQALMSGGTLVLARREALLPGPELLSLLRSESITSLTLPPSALALLPAADLPALGNLPALRNLVVAGEACPRDLIDLWAPGRRFINAYGPAEVTVGASMGRCVAGGPASLGRPFMNLRIHLLGRGGEPVPAGAPGEVHIAGPGLARCYTGRPALTATAFIPDPFAALFAAPGGRVYRTGDLARRLPDGQLEFCGRRDRQVKLRGFRVEPGEVEEVLRRHPAVREAAVTVSSGPGSEERLVAWVVPVEAGPEESPPAPGAASEPVPLLAALRRHLRSALPEHMVPAAFETLAELPRLPSGKVDRKALPAVSGQVARTAPHVAPRTPLEARLAALWCELLGLERVSVDDSFFDLGGHSLLVVRLHGRLKALGWEVEVVELFRHPTVAALAARLEEGGEERGPVHRPQAQERAERRRESEASEEGRRRQALQRRRRGGAA